MARQPRHFRGLDPQSPKDLTKCCSIIMVHVASTRSPLLPHVLPGHSEATRIEADPPPEFGDLFLCILEKGEYPKPVPNKQYRSGISKVHDPLAPKPVVPAGLKLPGKPIEDVKKSTSCPPRTSHFLGSLVGIWIRHGRSQKQAFQLARGREKEEEGDQAIYPPEEQRKLRHPAGPGH